LCGPGKKGKRKGGGKLPAVRGEGGGWCGKGARRHFDINSLHHSEKRKYRASKGRREGGEREGEGKKMSRRA